MYPSESLDDEALNDTVSGAGPELGVVVKDALGGEFVTMHPAKRNKTPTATDKRAIPRSCFSVTMRAYHTGHGRLCQNDRRLVRSLGRGFGVGSTSHPLRAF